VDNSEDIRRVAVVGTGLIGAAWAAYFLAQGLDVSATDPKPEAEAELGQQIDRAWPILVERGLRPGASRHRLSFTPDRDEAVRGADFVQENGPERESFKVELFAQLDALLPPTVVIASSSSGLMMTAIQARCRHPERCVIGHPFNPPYLIPLVEVVGGARTSEATIACAMAFYTRLGKRPIRLQKEVRGYIANRLQAALWREAIHLVAEGVASVADVDAAVAWGPGLRWSVMGPHMVFHLAGGAGGMQHFLDHLAEPVATWWQDLGQPNLDTIVNAKLVSGVVAEADGRSIRELEAYRDQMVAGLLALRERATAAKTT